MVALTAADDSLISLLKYRQDHNLREAFSWIKKKDLKMLRWKYAYVKRICDGKESDLW